MFSPALFNWLKSMSSPLNGNAVFRSDNVSVKVSGLNYTISYVKIVKIQLPFT